ncbi:MAG: hypothetical protein ACFFDW_09890 [Candidatus Thorarchaeota archaeon]
MSYTGSKAPKIVLLITLIVFIAVIALSIIITNVILNDWGFYEIFTAIGGTFLIVGGIGVISLYSGGYSVSNTRARAMVPELTLAESEYAKTRRNKFPIIAFILILIGIIFLAIGLSGLW